MLGLGKGRWPVTHTFANLLSSSLTASNTAKSCADQTPLVNAIFGEEADRRFIGSLAKGQLTIGRIRREGTTKAETELGISGEPVYFYAGRVYPAEIVPVVFLFGGILDKGIPRRETAEFQMRGGATPFDSGGLGTQQTHLKWVGCARDKKTYFDDHNLQDLSQWRNYFALHLTKFFKTPSDYWGRGPHIEIDGADLKGDVTKWRDWVFEIRSETSVELRRSRKIFINTDIADLLKREVIRLPHIGYFRRHMEAVDAPDREAERFAKERAIS